MAEPAAGEERSEGPGLRRTMAMGLWLAALFTALSLIGTCARFGQVPGLAAALAVKVGTLCAAYSVLGMLLFFRRGA